jgi:Carboxypeptidase regulatory-like domain
VATIATWTRRAAICGYVRDASSGTGIFGATVELVGREVQTATRVDGFYCFLDLPDGAYTLHATAPALGSRYGGVTVAGVAVADDGVGRPLFDPKGNLVLPPTRLSGRVQRAGTLAPIARAEVRLRASGVKAISDNLGQYLISAVEAGSQTVQIFAPGFITTSQSVTLEAGQNTVADFTLTPS